MKFKRKKKVYKTLNLSPGTMTYKGKKQSEITTFEVINYNKETLNKYELKKISDVLSLKESDVISWININ